MPSPFPGMDPYLEEPAMWPDVQQRLISPTADALQLHLEPRYYARIGEGVYVARPPRTMYPHVVLTRRTLREAWPVIPALIPSRRRQHPPHRKSTIG